MCSKNSTKYSKKRKSFYSIFPL